MVFPHSQIHISRPLTDFALQYLQDQKVFIANEVAPSVNMDKEVDLYYVYGRTNWKITDALRAPGSVSNRTRVPALSTDSYCINQYSLHEFVPDREVEEADAPIAPMQDATAYIMEQLLVAKEKAVANVLFLTASSANYLSMPAASKWDVTTTATPIKDVETARFTIEQEIGRNVNFGIMGRKVYKGLQSASDILDRIKYTERGLITEDIIGSVFDLENIVIGRAVYDSVTEEVTSLNVQYIWGNYFLLQHRNTLAGKKGLTHAKQFVKKGDNVAVKQWYKEDNEATKVEASIYYDFKVICTLAGYLITDPVGT